MFRTTKILSFFVPLLYLYSVPQTGYGEITLRAGVQIIYTADGAPYSIILKPKTLAGIEVIFGIDTGAPVSIINSSVLLLPGAVEALRVKEEASLLEPSFLGDNKKRSSIQLKGLNGDYTFVGAHLNNDGRSLGVLTGIFGNDILMFQDWRLDLSELVFEMGPNLIELNRDSFSIKSYESVDPASRRRLFVNECFETAGCSKVMFDTGIARFDIVRFFQNLPASSISKVKLQTPLGFVTCSESVSATKPTDVNGSTLHGTFASCEFSERPEVIPGYPVLGMRSIIEKKAIIEFRAASQRIELLFPKPFMPK